MKWNLIRILALLSLSVAPAISAVVTLYDAEQQSVTPDAYDPQYLAYFALGGSQAFSPGDTATNFNSTALGDAGQGGYSTNLLNPAFPILDRIAGFTLSFTVEILTESHTASNRSGFSVIAISSDVGSGVLSSIELGFHDGLIFAQSDSPLFTVGESVAFDPVGVGFVTYDLAVLGGAYQLFADGSPILGGALRDYTLFTGIPDVYEIPNFVFFGDDTTSAQGNINLRRVALLTDVPEPSTWTLLALGLIGLVSRRRRS